MNVNTQFYYPNVVLRKKSYDFIKKFIEEKTNGYKTPIETSLYLEDFQENIKKLDNGSFAFLLIHSGIIPEDYLPDSSEESFYSKLIEDLIREWAIRIGFEESYLPTEKSSKEDITIISNNKLIVCDAKAFRLSRSQPAPNVKDMLKEGDIKKWLSYYDRDMYIHLGGMVVFPSTHDWKKSSDFYQYTTNKDLPILALNYEHLAYMLIKKYPHQLLSDCYCNYHEIFPYPLEKKNNNNVSMYYKAIESFLFKNNEYQDWEDFKKFKDSIIAENAHHSYIQLERHKEDIEDEVKEKIASINDIGELKRIAIGALTKTEILNLDRKLHNIKKFRAPTKAYL